MRPHHEILVILIIWSGAIIIPGGWAWIGLRRFYPWKFCEFDPRLGYLLAIFTFYNVWFWWFATFLKLRLEFGWLVLWGTVRRPRVGCGWLPILNDHRFSSPQLRLTASHFIKPELSLHVLCLSFTLENAPFSINTASTHRAATQWALPDPTSNAHAQLFLCRHLVLLALL